MKTITEKDTSKDTSIKIQDIPSTIDLATPMFPARYRRVIELTVYENKTFEEAGKIIGISPKCAEARMYRAKKKIKKLKELLEKNYKGGGNKEIALLVRRWFIMNFN